MNEEIKKEVLAELAVLKELHITTLKEVYKLRAIELKLETEKAELLAYKHHLQELASACESGKLIYLNVENHIKLLNAVLERRLDER